MTADFSQQRVNMVDGQLRTTDVSDHGILAAMLTVPREEFVPEGTRQLAYIDEDLPVATLDNGEVRFLMEPSPFAQLLQLAELSKGDLVLDIGCGTGYSAAILSRLCRAVIALESEEKLARSAAATLERLGCDNVEVVTGNLAEGHRPKTPYDAIVIEGAVDYVPQELFDQLRDGGRLVTVVGEGYAARATIFYKEHGFVSNRRSFNAAVKSLAAFRKEKVFEF